MARKTVSSVVRTLLHNEQHWHDDPSPIRGLSTSFPSWDIRTGGLRPSEVTIVAARTSHGKTAISSQIAFHNTEALMKQAAETGEIPGQVVIFSPEMSHEQLLMRYASSTSGVPSKKVEQGKASAEERQAWRARLEYAEYFDPFLTIRAGRSVDAADMFNDIEGLHREKEIKLLIIDYLQRISGRGQSMYEQATYVSQHVKDIANALDIPVLAMSQVKRPDNRANPGPPSLFDLRDSGSLEQDADNVVILYLPENDDPDAVSEVRKAYVSIEKQRNGGTDKFPLYYRESVTRFEDQLQSIEEAQF